MNPHRTYAAETLTEEILSIDPDAMFSDGALDGLGWYRSLGVGSSNADRLLDLLVRVGQIDPRITAVDLNDSGNLKVTFASNALVDSRAPFGVKYLHDALAETQSTEAPAPKKRAAKKK